MKLKGKVGYGNGRTDKRSLFRNDNAFFPYRCKEMKTFVSNWITITFQMLSSIIKEDCWPIKIGHEPPTKHSILKIFSQLFKRIIQFFFLNYILSSYTHNIILPRNGLAQHERHVSHNRMQRPQSSFSTINLLIAEHHFVQINRIVKYEEEYRYLYVSYIWRPVNYNSSHWPIGQLISPSICAWFLHHQLLIDSNWLVVLSTL